MMQRGQSLEGRPTKLSRRRGVLAGGSLALSASIKGTASSTLRGNGLRCVGATLLALSLGACGTGFDFFPEEPSSTGAVTGGAIGAGLGAVIGSQTGDALGGATIGALAGAGAGYAIGDAVSERDDRYAAQQQTIERQAAMLKAQQAELEALRKLSSDQTSPYISSPVASGGSQGAMYNSQQTQVSEVGPTIPGGKKFLDPSTLNNPFLSSGYQYGSTLQGRQVGRGANQPYVQQESLSGVGSSQARIGAEVQFQKKKSHSSVVGSTLSAATTPSSYEKRGVASYDKRGVVSESGRKDAPAARIPSQALKTKDIKPSAPVTKVAKSNGATSKKKVESSKKVVVAAQNVRGALEPSALLEGEESLKSSNAKSSQAESPVQSNLKPKSSLGIALEVPEKAPKSPSVSKKVAVVKEKPAATQNRSDSVESDETPAKLVENSFKDCEKGESEASVAAGADSLIDKLFYLRRAQRFCPSEPKWYVELGNVYVALGRPEDAKTQYEDALQLKGDYAPAKKGLEGLEATETEVY